MDAFFGIIGSIATINEKIILDKISKKQDFLNRITPYYHNDWVQFGGKIILKFDFKMDAFFGIIGSIATINEKIILNKISKKQDFLYRITPY